MTGTASGRGVASFVNDSDGQCAGPLQRDGLQGRHGHCRRRPTPTPCVRWFPQSTALPAKRRSVVISGAGDRRDEDIREQTADSGQRAFDDIFLFKTPTSVGEPMAKCLSCCARD